MYKVMFIKEILAKIKNRKWKAQFIAENNLDTALQNQKFAELYHKERELMSKIAYEMAIGQEADTSEYEKVKDEQKQILLQLGLSPEDLKPAYICKKCNDTGIYDNNYCDCVKFEMSNKLLELSGYNKKLFTFKDSDFSIFDKENRAEIQSFYEKMQVWCNKDNKYKNIIISGNTGIGKTFLLECMANELINNNKYTVFTTAIGLNNNLLKYHTTFNDDSVQFIEPYTECDCLIIDDLGTEPVFNNVTLNYLYYIINQRDMEGKSIIITTNLSVEQLFQRYGERIVSRLLNRDKSIIYQMNNKDLRLSKKGGK